MWSKCLFCLLDGQVRGGTRGLGGYSPPHQRHLAPLIRGILRKLQPSVRKFLAPLLGQVKTTDFVDLADYLWPYVCDCLSPCFSFTFSLFSVRFSVVFLRLFFSFRPHVLESMMLGHELHRMYFFLVLHTLKHVKTQTIYKSSNRSLKKHFLKLELNWVSFLLDQTWSKSSVNFQISISLLL